MAHSVKDKQGNTTTQAPSGTSAQAYIVGPTQPPIVGMQARYILESGSGASCVYRWIADERTDGAAPTSFRFTGSN